ncbi:hypothetical protein [Jeotgalibacillus haloalkalitolerans]|uniref:Uncharacterized protein n=1 Tax=Jeotgalibacillus haloalkalitolerans TaxID=3104292 RepID=A0ABU5KLW1_9BACL|nr:hypothetical protein [Jeotgalibacillus sp. HH7-29]MDZ5712250.1 hypothetical protein [Jeotgalibacillus sp. HH7-29]
MKIYDGSRAYNTDYIDSIKYKDDRDSVERDILNAFFRLAYWYYMRIRDCVNTKKCKKMKVQMIRERLTDERRLLFTKEKLKINEEQIHYILNFNEEFNEAIK